tara:strand:+ start:803 stop:2329 length:1527 start_codon:yes stop_codon:yes gene_type:complete
MGNKFISKIHPKMALGYKGVNKNYSNRSSCVFPILISECNDVNIVFLNYWSLKNNLKSVICNMRIYDTEGVLKEFFTKKIVDSHNNFSIKSIVNFHQDSRDFIGIVNIEIVSEENLSFTFPAITAFYSSRNNFSAVHAAGRIKNTEESKYFGVIRETNWTCKWEKGITPFFSIFNGACNGILDKLNIKIRNPDKSILREKSIQIDLLKPFQNRLIFLDELFDYDVNAINSEAYVEVDIPCLDIFPRMICGNYHKSDKFLEVTHSFEDQENNLDYLPENKVEEDNLSYSINPIATIKDLNLELMYFPTNCVGRVKGYWRTGTYNQSLYNHDDSFDWICGGEDSNLKKIKINNSNVVKALDIIEGRIPTRINTNYIYKVVKSSLSYSTDIAAGHVTKYFPPKKRSWGHGIIGGGYISVLLMTSFAQDDSTRIESKGKLVIYTNKKEYISFHTIPKEGAIKINLNELVDDNLDIKKPNIISWFYDQEERTKLMTYWISYTPSGQITGDHAF